MDAYTLWKFNSNAQLRFAVNNLVNNNAYSSNTVALGGITQTASKITRTYTTWTMRWLELKI